MNYDRRVPEQLKSLQMWFGGVIGRSLDERGGLRSLSPSGHRMCDEAEKNISPSPTLKPAERLQIYNQQYWWRLLATLHEIFPTVVRFIGYDRFNQTLAIPYLEKYPPNHWSLAYLANRLPRWLEESYQGKDKAFLKELVQLDAAFNDSFIVKEQTPILMDNLPVEGDPNSLMGRVIYLQDHVHIFSFHADLFSFRSEILKQKPEHWMSNPLPSLNKGPHYFILFRNLNRFIDWKQISQVEFLLLQRFSTGSTVDAACDWLETQKESVQLEASAHLQQWFQEWLTLRLLTLANL